MYALNITVIIYFMVCTLNCNSFPKLQMQGMLSTSISFIEESDPLAIAESFYLRDFDSPDTNNANLDLTVTLTNAVDGSNEGLMFYTDGTGIIVDAVVNAQEFSIQYVLSNATSYIEYQQVSLEMSL